MDTNKIVISFIIPSRNEEEYITDCIRSIRNQNISVAYEIIVVDNSSSDKTAQIARENEVIVIHEKKVGLSYSRMCGVKKTRGNILVFIDADTRLPSKWVAKCLQHFSNDKRIVAVSCGFSFYDGELLEQIGLFLTMSCIPLFNSILELFNKPNVIYGSAYAIRKDTLLKVGGVDMAFPFYAEDIALSHRIHPEGKIYFDSSMTVLTSARRYHRLGIIKTLYYYLYPMLLLELGMYERARKFVQKHADGTK